MISNYEEEYENREAAKELLLCLKNRRSYIKLKAFKLEKDTIVYIRDDENANNKFQKFSENLKRSRKLSFRDW